MALDTFSGLKAQAANYLDNPGWFNDLANDFVALFEAKINRNLRVAAQQVSITLTPVSGEADLPSDFLELVRLTWVGSYRRQLEYVDPAYLQGAYPDEAAGEPSVFTLEAGKVKVRPIDGTNLELVYYQKIPALSDSNTSNWLLASHPDLYLWGLLTEAYAFKADVEKATDYDSRAAAAVDEMNRLDRARRSPSAIRVAGPTP